MFSVVVLVIDVSPNKQSDCVGWIWVVRARDCRKITLCCSRIMIKKTTTYELFVFVTMRNRKLLSVCS